MTSSVDTFPEQGLTVGHCVPIDHPEPEEQFVLTDELIDVAVIGGGICGLAVTLQ